MKHQNGESGIQTQKDSGSEPPTSTNSSASEATISLPGKGIPSFSTEPFRPVDFGRPLMVSLGTVLLMSGAVAVGWLAAMLGQYRYVAVVFPLGMATLLAGIGYEVVRLGRIRGKVLLLIGLAAGLMANVTMHYFNYRAFMNGQGASLPFDPGVSGYLDLVAQQGIPMRPFPMGILPESPIGNLSHAASWWFLRLELLLTGTASALFLFLVGKQVSGVICPGCKDWKQPQELGLFLYSVSPFSMARVGETVTTALANGELACLWLPEGDPKRKLESYLLTTHICPRCPDARMDLQVQKGKPGEQECRPGPTLLWVSYPVEALPCLDQLCRHSREEK